MEWQQKELLKTGNCASTDAVFMLQDRIQGAIHFGHAWLIPADVEKPQVGWRRKKENNKWALV